MEAPICEKIYENQPYIKKIYNISKKAKILTKARKNYFDSIISSDDKFPSFAYRFFPRLVLLFSDLPIHPKIG